MKVNMHHMSQIHNSLFAQIEPSSAGQASLLALEMTILLDTPCISILVRVVLNGVLGQPSDARTSHS